MLSARSAEPRSTRAGERLARAPARAPRAARSPTSPTRCSVGRARLRAAPRRGGRDARRRRARRSSRARSAARAHRQRGAASAASVAFMFPGGGAQYPDMGRELYETEPVFRERGRPRACALLRGRAREPADLRALLFPAPERRGRGAAEALRAAGRAQLPALFVVEYALAQLLDVVGHRAGGDDRPQHRRVRRGLPGRRVLARGRAARWCSLRGAPVRARCPRARCSSVPLPGGRAARRCSATTLDSRRSTARRSCVVSGPVRGDRGARGAARRARASSAGACRIHVAAHSRDAGADPRRVRAVLPRRSALRAAAHPVRLEPDRHLDHRGRGDRPRLLGAPPARHRCASADGAAARCCDDPDRVLLEVGPGRTLATSLARQQPARARARRRCTSLRHPEDDVPRRRPSCSASSAGSGSPASTSTGRRSRARRAPPARVAADLPVRAPAPLDRAGPRAPSRRPTRRRAARAPRRRRRLVLRRPTWRQAPLAGARGGRRRRASGVAGVRRRGGPRRAARRAAARARAHDGGDRARTGAAFAARGEHALRAAPGRGRGLRRAAGARSRRTAACPRGSLHLWTSAAPRGGSSRRRRARRTSWRSASTACSAWRRRSADRTPAGPLRARGGRRPACSRWRARPSPARARDGARARAGVIRRSARACVPQHRRRAAAPGHRRHGARCARAPARASCAPRAGPASSPTAAASASVQRFEPVRLAAPAPGRSRLRAGGVYLITGGLGGLGLALARAPRATACRRSSCWSGARRCRRASAGRRGSPSTARDDRERRPRRARASARCGRSSRAGARGAGSSRPTSGRGRHDARGRGGARALRRRCTA